MRTLIAVAALATLSLAAWPLLSAGHEPAKEPQAPLTFDERLGTLGAVRTEFTTDKWLEGEWYDGQVVNWVVKGIVTRSAGNGPDVSSGSHASSAIGGISFGGTREDVFRTYGRDVKAVEIEPIRTREGRLIYQSLDGTFSDTHPKGSVPQVAVAYGTAAEPYEPPDYATLLRQPLLRMHATEVRGPSVPDGTRRFTLAATVLMAVPSSGVPAGSHEGPIDEVYAESTTVNVPRTIGDSPDSQDAPYWGAADPDLNAAMLLAVPRVLDDFAVRLGAARLRYRHNGDVGAPGLDEIGKEEILAKAATRLPGWKNSGAMH